MEMHLRDAVVISVCHRTQLVIVKPWRRDDLQLRLCDGSAHSMDGARTTGLKMIFSLKAVTFIKASRFTNHLNLPRSLFFAKRWATIVWGWRIWLRSEMTSRSTCIVPKEPSVWGKQIVILLFHKKANCLDEFYLPHSECLQSQHFSLFLQTGLFEQFGEVHFNISSTCVLPGWVLIYLSYHHLIFHSPPVASDFAPVMGALHLCVTPNTLCPTRERR